MANPSFFAANPVGLALSSVVRNCSHEAYYNYFSGVFLYFRRCWKGRKQILQECRYEVGLAQRYDRRKGVSESRWNENSFFKYFG